MRLNLQSLRIAYCIACCFLGQILWNKRATEKTNSVWCVLVCKTSFELKTCNIRDVNYNFCALCNRWTEIRFYDVKNPRRSESEPTKNPILWLQITNFWFLEGYSGLISWMNYWLNSLKLKRYKQQAALNFGKYLSIVTASCYKKCI